MSAPTLLENTSFHEVVLGIAFLILLVTIGVLLGFERSVPAELYALTSAIFGVETGIQVPSGAQRAQLARQADQMAALVTSVSNRPTTLS